MLTEKLALVLVAAALAIGAGSCASEPKPRPTKLDPSNPAAPESPPLAAPALNAGGDAAQAPRPSPAPVDAGAEPPADHAGHAHDHSAGASTAPRQQYTCPMHPEVVSDRPGSCPKCGMKLVPKQSGGGAK